MSSLLENQVDENADSDDELLFDSNTNIRINKEEYEIYFEEVISHKTVSI